MTAVLNGYSLSDPRPSRDVRQSLWRGFRGACPKCGQGKLFGSYLKVRSNCGACGEDFSPQRADDAPPYVTMMIVGHLLILGVALLEDTYAPPAWVHFVVWLPVATAMTLGLLPRVKGAIVGLQWAVRMHGFGEGE